MSEKEKTTKEPTTSFTMWLPVSMKTRLKELSNQTDTPMAQLAVAALKAMYFAETK